MGWKVKLHWRKKSLVRSRKIIWPKAEIWRFMKKYSFFFSKTGHKNKYIFLLEKSALFAEISQNHPILFSLKKHGIFPKSPKNVYLKKPCFLQNFSQIWIFFTLVFCRLLQKIYWDKKLFWGGARNSVGKKKVNKKRYHDDDDSTTNFVPGSNYSLSCRSFCLSLPLFTSRNFFLCFPLPQSIQNIFWENNFRKKVFLKKKNLN